MRIALDLDCCEHAADFALLRGQLAGYTEPWSVLAIPPDPDAHAVRHRTLRRRSARAMRRCYRFARIKRERHERDIYAINTSLGERQGRPMTSAYRRPVEFPPLPDYTCPRHAVVPYGVLASDGTLVAYLWAYRVGDLMLWSSILGHGDHLANDVMYLLADGAIRDQAQVGGVAVYGNHTSGTDGLRYYKSKVGFQEADVEWCP